MPLDEKTLQQLRRQAEQLFHQQYQDQPESPRDELQQELSVRNIELELQNQQLRESELKLFQALERYDKLYHQAPVGYLSLDSQGTIHEFNETFADLCQIPAAKLKKRFLATLLTAESAAVFRQRLPAFYKQPEQKTLEVWLQGNRKDPVYVQIRGKRQPFDDQLSCNLINRTGEKQAEDQLIAVKERFSLLFEHMGNGVVVYRAINQGHDFIFVELNKAAEKIENIDRYAVLGRHLTEIFPAVEKFGLLEVFRKVWKTGVPQAHPVTEYIDERIHGWRDNYVYKLPTGEIVSIFTDVTKQKQIEIALAESEERLKIATAGTRDGLWDLNLETDVAFMSDRYSTMLGYEPDELPRSSEAWSNLLHPDDKPQAVEKLQAYLTRKVDIYESTFRMKAKDGSYRWITGRGQAIWDKTGKPVRIIGFNTDVTSLIETQEQLAKAHKIINRSPITVFEWHNQRGWPVGFVTANVKTLLGYEAEELISGDVSYADRIHPEDLERVNREVEEGCLQGRHRNKIIHEPYRLFTKTGGTIWVADQTYICRDEQGEITHFEGIVYDITEEHLAKEEIVTLRGILPICMYCKEIRDEAGYWNQLEKYISEHSGAEFSHGICEKCAATMFPDQYARIKKEDELS